MNKEALRIPDGSKSRRLPGHAWHTSCCTSVEPKAAGCCTTIAPVHVAVASSMLYHSLHLRKPLVLHTILDRQWSHPASAQAGIHQGVKTPKTQTPCRDPGFLNSTRRTIQDRRNSGYSAHRLYNRDCNHHHRSRTYED